MKLVKNFLISLAILSACVMSYELLVVGDPGQNNAWARNPFNKSDKKKSGEIFNKLLATETPATINTVKLDNFERVLAKIKSTFGKNKKHLAILGDLAYNESKFLPGLSNEAYAVDPKTKVAHDAYKTSGWTGGLLWLDRTKAMLNAVAKIFDGFTAADSGVDNTQVDIIVGNHQMDTNPEEVNIQKGKLYETYGSKANTIWYSPSGVIDYATAKTQADFLIRYPKVVVTKTVVFIDINMTILKCGMESNNVSKFWSLEGTTYAKLNADKKSFDYTVMKGICENYYKAFQQALKDIKAGAANATLKAKGYVGPWKVMRSHESPYNIEGDDSNAQKLVEELVGAGIRVNLASHFHVGAVMVKENIKESSLPVYKQQLDYLKKKESNAVEFGATGLVKAASKTLTHKYNLLKDTSNGGAFLQIVIGHSGRFLDPLDVGITTSSKILFARGRTIDAAADFIEKDKFGFAFVEFEDSGKYVKASFYTDVITEKEPEVVVTINTSDKKLKRRLK